MAHKLAIICPGQGGQHRHMFDMARTDPVAAQALDDWWRDCGCQTALQTILDDESLLFANRFAQPLIVAASLALWQAIRNFVPAPVPSLVAGYSIGELSAYAIAGALAPTDALKLAVTRAALMDACCDADPAKKQGLAAISGVLPGAIGAIGDLLHRHGLSLAIKTGPDSFIVGGLRTAINAIAPGIAQLGARLTPLAVEVAAHTPAMQAAVAPFQGALEQTRFSAPNCPVIAGISAELITRKEQALPALSRQIAETIRWADSMDACVEAGVDVVLECGPGSALSRMMAARHPQLVCRAVADFRTLAGLETWLGRNFN